MIRSVALTAAMLALAACGAVYKSPSVTADDGRVRVIPLTGESVLLANRSPYQPQTLPALFYQTAPSGGAPSGIGAVPEPVSGAAAVDFGATRLPPPADPGPYRIGVSDVVAIAMSGQSGTNGAGQTPRESYTVQDDGAIALPTLGRVQIAGLTLREAEATLFERFVANQIDPAFSLDVVTFNAARVSIGGAVRTPGTQPIALAPLYLDAALGTAGGVVASDRTDAVVRLYRDGTLYQMPVATLYSGERIRLVPGDSVFVDVSNDLEQAQAFFAEQIRVAELRQSTAQAALQRLNTEIGLQRAALAEARSNYLARVQLDSVERDYVYLVGEITKQGRFTMPPERTASLADALYSEAGGIPVETGDVSQIYVLRGSDDRRDFGAVTAWHLDGRNASNFVLATRFELRPDDVVFVAEQPVTRWGRVVRQITPTLINTTISAAQN